MAFKQVRRRIRRRLIAPTVSIARAGIYFNRAAVELVGQDKRAVLLSIDVDGKAPVIGMWFHKDKPTSPHTQDAFAVVPYPSGVSRVSCKRFIEDYGLLRHIKSLGKVSFMLILDKEQETGTDFYHAILE